ncbi:hypothetical protein VTO42DRAFT_2916 [Malbranchea cinnamomea]
MFVPRPISPLSFEPLSPSPSEVVFASSDSESDLDDVARAAKRRRIEQLGEDYLRGKPPFILTASLRGPFEDGWNNPWTRNSTKEQARTTVDNAPKNASSNSIVIPESVPRHFEQDHPSVSNRSPSAPFARTTPHLPDSAVGSCRGFSESRQSPARRGITTSRYFGTSTKPSASVKSDSHGSDLSSLRRKKKGEAMDVDAVWLKKDKKLIHHRVIDPPKSPSPTPPFRHTSRLGNKRSQQVAEGHGIQKGSVGSSDNRVELWTSGFTPINPPVQCHVASSRPPEPSSTAFMLGDDSSSHELRDVEPGRQAMSTKGKADFSKPPAPSSTKTRLGDDGENPQSIRSISTSLEEDIKSRDSLHKVPSAGHPPGFEFYRRDKSHPDDGPRSTSSLSAKEDTLGSHMQASNKRSKEIVNVDHAGTEVSNNLSIPKSKLLSTNNSHDLPSLVTESDNIISAQIVPHVTRSTDAATLSLASTDLAVPTKNPTEAQRLHVSNDDGLSTQVAVAMAQKSLQDDLVSPEKANPAGPSGGYTSLPITPFRVFQPPSRTPALNEPQSADDQQISTQAIVNAISPHDLSTMKETKTADLNEVGADGRKGSATVGFETSSNNRTKTGSQHPSQAGKIGPSDDPSTSDSSRADGIHQPLMSRALLKQSSAQSTGTALPTLNSTHETGHQDGQGGMESFDLHQAIAEAGTFLRQSFDFEQDLSFISRRNDTSSDKALLSL